MSVHSALYEINNYITTVILTWKHMQSNFKVGISKSGKLFQQIWFS